MSFQSQINKTRRLAERNKEWLSAGGERDLNNALVEYLYATANKIKIKQLNAQVLRNKVDIDILENEIFRGGK